MASVSNGSRRWVDRIANETVRLVLVVIVALGASYLTLARDHRDLFESSHTNCAALERITQNQRTVLLTQLALIDVLDDRQRAGLRQVPQELRTSTLAALANLPDELTC